jgi:hypothetical protein
MPTGGSSRFLLSNRIGIVFAQRTWRGLLAEGTPPMREHASERSQESGEVGDGLCEVYGALVERLTAKALRQMQHWTDIQVVSEPGGDFRSLRSTR